MKILIIGNHDDGIYSFRLELLLRLIKDGHKLYISVPFGNKKEKLETIGCHVLVTNFNRRGINPIKDLLLLKTYKKIMQKINPDIVLTYTIKPNVYGGLACQALKIPYIANITGLGTSLEKEGFLQKITKGLYKFGLKGAKNVFFQNTTNMNFMIENGIVKKDICKLLPGSGVNLTKYSLQEYPNDEKITFMFFSRIMEEKGINQYLKAAENISKRKKNVIFNVYGEFEDEYDNKYFNYLVNKKIINYYGETEDTIEAYKNCHCLIHPTYYPEGMSNVLLESLACGRPIITTDRPGCKEIVDDEINGFVVKQRNYQDLIEKIEKFLELSYEQKKQMGINGRRKVEREFDRNTVIEKYIEAIK